MNNGIIAPARVVKNYLPDYENRLAEYIGECRENNVNQVLDYVLIKEFCATHFPEALDAFAKSICEQQREGCAQAYVDYNGEDTDYETVSEAIYNAPMPDLTKNR